MNTPVCRSSSIFFFFNDTATTEIYTLSLHDALPIFGRPRAVHHGRRLLPAGTARRRGPARLRPEQDARRATRLRALQRLGDRKSTRLNSSHSQISYAVFCLKKKKKIFALIIVVRSRL